MQPGSRLYRGQALNQQNAFLLRVTVEQLPISDLLCCFWSQRL
jgi:hypothetical protein